MRRFNTGYGLPEEKVTDSPHRAPRPAKHQYPPEIAQAPQTVHSVETGVPCGQKAKSA